MSDKSDMIVTESEMMLDSDLGPIVTGAIDFTTRVITDHFLLVYESLIGHAHVDVSDSITKRKIIESAVERLVNELQERGVDSIFSK
jgi:hypothetical protein